MTPVQLALLSNVRHNTRGMERPLVAAVCNFRAISLFEPKMISQIERRMSRVVVVNS